EKSDPLKYWKDQLIQESVITVEEFARLDNEVKERIRREYAEAEKAEDPSPDELLADVTKLGTAVSQPPKGALESAPPWDKEVLPPGKYRIGDTVNKTLRVGLE